MGGSSSRGRGVSEVRNRDPRMVQLKAEITELSASIHAAEAELNAKLAELDEGDGWCGIGVRSMAHWLTWTCGFTSSEAERRCRLAERRSELPLLFGAFDAGKMSVGFAHSAARVATPATDAEVARVATSATHPQAARTFAAFRNTAQAIDDNERERDRRSGDAESPEAASEGPQPEGPGADDAEGFDPLDRSVWLNTWWDEQHHLRVDARLDPTDGATLRTLLDHLRDHMAPRAGDGSRASAPQHSGESGTDPSGPAGSQHWSNGRWLSQPEALSELLRLAGDALAHAGVRGRWHDRFAITVTIDAATLTGERPGSGILPDGSVIDADQVRAWVEAATLEPLLMSGGRPLFLGRRVRLATPAQRRALLARDGGCAFPGCGRTQGLDAHHVIEWTDGGRTDVDAMVLLCRRHHRLLHKGEYTISMTDGIPRIHTEATGEIGHRPEGRPLAETRTGDPPQPDATWRYGDRLTRYGLDVLVSSLLTARRQGRERSEPSSAESAKGEGEEVSTAA